MDGPAPDARRNSEFAAASVYCDAASTNAQSIFKELGFRFVSTPEEADLIWMRKGYQRLYSRLAPHQLLNHIPNETAITSKGHLTANLKRHDLTGLNRDLPLRNFYQETYCLDDPAERKSFFVNLRAKSPGNLRVKITHL